MPRPALIGLSTVTALVLASGCNRTPVAAPKAAADVKTEPAVTQSSTPPSAPQSDLSKLTPEQKARTLQSRALLGFSRLTKSDRPDEPWFDYSGNKTSTHFLRQDGLGHEMGWETAVVGGVPKEQPVTFMFAGAFGWLSLTKTEGFSLLINGQDTLRFDVTKESQEWKSQDGRVSLFYYPTWTGPRGPDSSGLFFLTLPPEQVKQNQPCQLAVRSLGEGSQRWFGVHPHSDVTSATIPTPVNK